MAATIDGAKVIWSDVTIEAVVPGSATVAARVAVANGAQARHLEDRLSCCAASVFTGLPAGWGGVEVVQVRIRAPHGR
eukprot:1347641-Pyramimonas_sp.AAC.3